MSKTDEYIVTVHVKPDCSPETLLALSEMVKCLIKHIEQRSPTLREAVAGSRKCPYCNGTGHDRDDKPGEFCKYCKGTGHF